MRQTVAAVAVDEDPAAWIQEAKRRMKPTSEEHHRAAGIARIKTSHQPSNGDGKAIMSAMRTTKHEKACSVQPEMIYRTLAELDERQADGNYPIVIWLTLTAANHRIGQLFAEGNQVTRRFLQRVQRIAPDAGYILVREHGKEHGRPHLHMVLILNKLPKGFRRGDRITYDCRAHLPPIARYARSGEEDAGASTHNGQKQRPHHSESQSHMYLNLDMLQMGYGAVARYVAKDAGK